MANLIILEGLSRTGKSTISKALGNKGFRSISIKDKMPEYVTNLHEFYHGMHLISNEMYRAFPEETFIVDRSFLSDLVYSKFFGRKTLCNQSEITSNILLENNFLLVYLSSTYERYIQRGPKDRTVYTEEDFVKQKDLFDWYFQKYRNDNDSDDWKSRFVEINSAEVSIEDSIKTIESRFQCLHK